MEGDVALQTALTLLSHSFSLYTRREAEGGVLQKQLRLFAAFSIQLLRHLQLLDKNVREWAIATIMRVSVRATRRECGSLSWH